MSPEEEAGSATSAPATPPHGRDLEELDREECLRLLAQARFGRLAVSRGEGAPVIRPVNYVFDQASQSVVFRTARGSKFHALARATNAAFEIDSTDDLQRIGWSVIIVGVTEEITSPSELARLEALDLEPWAAGDKPHWIHIRAWTVSGRRLVPPSQPLSSPAS